MFDYMGLPGEVLAKKAEPMVKSPISDDLKRFTNQMHLLLLLHVLLYTQWRWVTHGQSYHDQDEIMLWLS